MYAAIWVQSDDGMQCVDEWEADETASLDDVKASIITMLRSTAIRLEQASAAEGPQDAA